MPSTPALALPECMASSRSICIAPSTASPSTLQLKFTICRQEGVSTAGLLSGVANVHGFCCLFFLLIPSHEFLCPWVPGAQVGAGLGRYLPREGPLDPGSSWNHPNPVSEAGLPPCFLSCVLHWISAFKFILTLVRTSFRLGFHI